MQDILHLAPIDILSEFAGRVVDSLLVGGVVAWLLSLGRIREKNAAKAQIAEQLCRVFGMRLYRNPKTNSFALEELTGKSLQGWASLDRLQTNLDMHRADISSTELTLVQAIIEDLLRIRANQLTMELHILDEYLPAAAKRFLPGRLREQFLERATYFGLPNLTDSASMTAVPPQNVNTFGE
ncbi:MAG: hypothetical protein KBA31_18250 [Alphaproteobacteria bacterium]|nr:hypothetical protein [Alphaproteobacteria bacterium]